VNLTARIAATFNRSGIARDNVVGAAAMPAVSRGSKGTGAPSSRRLRTTLAVLALAIAAFAVTAAPASAAPPVPKMGAITEIKGGSIHLTGEVNANGFEAIYYFQYSTDEANWTSGPGKEQTGTEYQSVQGDLTGLKADTEYFVRLVTDTGFGGKSTSVEPYPSFTTLSVASPSVTAVDNASEIVYTTATATGKVKRPAPIAPDPADDTGIDLNCRFEYITDAQFKENEEVNSEPGFTGATPVDCEPNPVKAAGESAVTAHLKGLAPNTTYHLRLTATNAGGADSKVAASTFTTLTVDPPTVISTDNATEVEYSRAQVKGVVERPANADPAFDITACNFEYVTDAQFKENEEDLSQPGFTGATPVACQPEGTITATGHTPVEAKLTGLVASTIYHLRLSASNQGGADAKEAAATFTTQGPVPKPTVLATDDATGVTIHEAQVKGQVERPAGADPALDVNCRFEYITDKQFNENVANSGPGAGFEGATPAYCPEPITSPDPGHPAVSAPVSAELTGLVPARTYHLRLVAENSAGGVDTREATHTFTTEPAELPAVTIDPVAGGTFTTAHVSGTFEVDDPAHTANGDPAHDCCLASWDADISTDGGKTWEFYRYAKARKISTANPNVWNLEADFTGLQPNSTYSFRLKSYYEGGVSLEEAEARGEMAFSPVETITTEPLFAPTATINPVTGVTATTAHLSGTVDPHAPAGPLSDLGKQAFATHWELVCAPDCKDRFGNVIGGIVQGEEGPKLVAADVEGLDPNTHYEVSLVVHSEGGEETVVETFNTPRIKPTVKSAAGASDGEGGYTLQGVVDPNNSEVIKCEFKWGPTAPEYAFSAPCSPMPKGQGRDEVQSISNSVANGGVVQGGQFKLTYRGQTTADLPFNATGAEVQAALEALPTIGLGSVAVTGKWTVTFQGSLKEVNAGQITVKNGTEPLTSSFGPVATNAKTLINGNAGITSPITVEAHLTGLNPGAIYHADLVATNAAGTEDSKDFEFTPTLNPKGPACPNEALREENNSLALPECRAYEKVTPGGKEGFPAELADYTADTVLFSSYAGNLAGSGTADAIYPSLYVTDRTAAGWETTPNLNGPGGSMSSPPYNAIFKVDTVFPHYSADFRSSLWLFPRKGEPSDREIWLRRPDGSLASVGRGCIANCVDGGVDPLVGASDDLSHIVYGGFPAWGPGVYEFVGTGNDEPRRVDLDNSGAPISTCKRRAGTGTVEAVTAGGRNAVSADGRVIFVTSVGCTGTAGPPANEVWARVNGTTSFDVSGSQCNRTVADPGGVCSAPAPTTCTNEGAGRETCESPSDAHFQGAAADGSRVFFTTAQQLVNGDTDQTNDLYACDIPSGTPTPVGEANPCDALREVSGATIGADVENAYAISPDGSTAYFTAKGVLADNEDALGNTAQAGDRNLYAWRTDSAHPDGQTRFLARLTDSGRGPSQEAPQTTPDGRYLVFLTATPLLPTDTDEAIDVYRYDAESGLLSRVSTRLTGVGGNGEFDVQISSLSATPSGQFRARHVNSAISDDGQKVVFSTPEPLSPVDGNDAKDVYLWTPAGVSLITTGSVGGGEALRLNGSGTAAISSSGRDIFFATAGKLVASDGDQSGDVYDARVDGGFTNPPPRCSGESCQPPAPTPPSLRGPGSGQPSSGNPPQPKPCPKGKVRKHGKCVKKHTKGQKHKKSHKKAGHNRGGSK
jgi:hypothetical protein